MQVKHFQAIQEGLIDIITDAHHGKLSPELLTPKELQAHLRTIHNYDTQTSKLPVPISDVTQYYRLMTISHQITENYIIFNVQIPLTTPTNFELLQLTAVPWLKNNTFIKLQLKSNYLIADLLRKNHMALSSEEVHKCISIDRITYLCPQLHPMHNHNSPANQCEMAILKTSKVTSTFQSIAVGSVSYWSPLHESNAWLYSVGNNEPVHIVCNSTPSQTNIRGSGIMRIEEGCILKTPYISIEGHSVITKTRQAVYAPIFNISQLLIDSEIAEQKGPGQYKQNNEEIKNLQIELSKFKTISLNTIRPHDIHHYSISYTILSIVICCAICIIMLYWKQKQSNKAKKSHTSPQKPDARN